MESLIEIAERHGFSLPEWPVQIETEECITAREAIRRSKEEGGDCVTFPWDPDLETDLTIECEQCFYHPADYYYLGNGWRVRLLRP